MRFTSLFVTCAFAICSVLGEVSSHVQVNNRFWVTRIKAANASEIARLAKRNGFRYHKQVSV